MITGEVRLWKLTRRMVRQAMSKMTWLRVATSRVSCTVNECEVFLPPAAMIVGVPPLRPPSELPSNQRAPRPTEEVQNLGVSLSGNSMECIPDLPLMLARK